MTILSDRVAPSDPAPAQAPAGRKRSPGAAFISWITSTDHKVIGYLYIGLATRNRRASEMTVGEVVGAPVYSCFTDDEVHRALETMKQHRHERQPRG